MIFAAIVLALLFRLACVSGSRVSIQLKPGCLAGDRRVDSWRASMAWVPIWQMLLLGLLLAAGTATVRAKLSMNVQPAADFIAVAAMAFLSVTPPQTGLVCTGGDRIHRCRILPRCSDEADAPAAAAGTGGDAVALFALLALQVSTTR